MTTKREMLEIILDSPIWDGNADIDWCCNNMSKEEVKDIYDFMLYDPECDELLEDYYKKIRR